MSASSKSLKNYINDGDYFLDAKNWYKHKYIHPFTQRSFIFILGIIASVLAIGIVFNINSIFPVNIKVQYSIKADIESKKTANIIRADKFGNDIQKSVADIMVKNYLINREQFNYQNLRKQMIFVKNNSTRLAFRQFYQSIDSSNPTSPLLKYKNEFIRKIEVTNIKHLTPTKIVANFRSTARNITGKIMENILWEVLIDFEMDQIIPGLPAGSRFNFLVTDYNLKLLKKII